MQCGEHLDRHRTLLYMNSNVGVREEKKITQKEIRVWQKEIKKGVLFAKSLYKDGGTLQRQIFFCISYLPRLWAVMS